MECTYIVLFAVWMIGLDVLILVKSEIAKINKFHKKFFKQITHLPEQLPVIGSNSNRGRNS